MDPNDNRDFPDSFGGQGNSINDNLGVEKITGIPTIDKVQKTGYTPTITSRSKVRELEDEAKRQAQLDVASGVSHVLDDYPKEDYTSTKELFKKTLGVTEYDEIRTKLHLRDDESFTEYYNRSGGYVPKGYETQAKLLLAEEKRKMLYAEVEAGNMSEEDFLYEAYGKDLLKQEGIDFESKLYWYQRMKNTNDPTRFEDPRDNAVFMEDLIKNARALFQQESWYREAATTNIMEMSKYVTGEVLDSATVVELFPEFFENVSANYETVEQLIKYYRGGLLQGFNPTIDADGDGKVDFYYSTDGKLYNVSETGKGANTMRAIYNEDGSLNRIVRADTYGGELLGSFVNGLATIFTDIVDLGALALGAVVDVFDGGGFGDTLAEYTASVNQFFNQIPVIGDQDYVVDSGWTTSDGDANWANYGRQLTNLIGAIVPTVVIAIFTGGSNVAGKAVKEGVEEGAEQLAKRTVKKAGQELSEKAIKKTVKETVEATVKRELGEATIKETLKTKTKAAGAKVIQTAVALTKYQYGFGGSGWAARAGSAATVALKETLSTTAALKVNQETLGLTDGEIVSKSLAFGAINFASGCLLRSVGDESALGAMSNLFKNTAKEGSEVFSNFAVKRFFQKIASEQLSTGGRWTYGITNAIMDGLDNILTTFVQTSLTQEGKLFSTEGFQSVLNNPQLAMNMVYQSYQNFADVKHISATKIMEANTDAFKIDTTVRTYLNGEIARLEAEKDYIGSKAVQKLLIAYDQELVRLTSTENAELKAKLEKNAEKDAKKAAKKNAESESTEVEVVDPANVSAPNYTKAEAIIMTVADLVENKLKLNADHKLVTDLREMLSDSVSKFMLMRTDNIFKQINADNAAYTRLANGFFKGQLAKFIYGKASRDLQINYMKTVYNYYYKGQDAPRFISGDTQADIMDQLITDTVELGKLYDKIHSDIIEPNKEKDSILNEIKVETLSSIIAPAKKRDGTLKTTNTGKHSYNIRYDVTSNERLLNLLKDGSDDILKFVRSLTPQQQSELDRVLWIHIDREGNKSDSADAQTDSESFMAATHAFWEEILGKKNNPIVKLNGGTYLIKPMGLGMNMMDLQNMGIFISSVSSLKLALQGNISKDRIKKAFQGLISSSGHLKKAVEFDTAIEDNIDIIPSLINSLVNSGSFKLRDAAAMVNYLKQIVSDHNTLAESDKKSGKKVIALPKGESGTKFDQAVKLAELLEDYDGVSDILRGRKHNDDLTDKELKTINAFIKKYGTMNANGEWNNNETLTIAESEKLLSTGQIKAIKDIRNFTREKVDTSLESTKLQRKGKRKSTQSNDDIDVAAIQDYLITRFDTEDYSVTLEVPNSKGKKKSNIQVSLKDIGTDLGYKAYLSSLKLDPEDETVRANNIEGYTKAVLDSIDPDWKNDNTLYPIEDLIKTAVDRKASSYHRKKARDAINTRLRSKKDNRDLLKQDFENVKVIANIQEKLDNHTNMIYIDLNILSSATGTKIYNILENMDPTKRKALSKKDNQMDIMNLLLPTWEDQQEFKQSLRTIKRVQELYGADSYLELPIDSKLCVDILTALGYHTRAITQLTNGELVIPGVYFNSNNEGIKIATRDNALNILGTLRDEIDHQKSEALNKTIKFRDPLNTLEDTSGLITLVDESVKLKPNTIILNSIRTGSDFEAVIEENFNLILTAIKQGKNAGSLFKYLLSSTTGAGISGEADTHLDKIVKSYKIITAFAELFDEPNSYGVQLMSKESVELLRNTYSKTNCFIFTDREDGKVEVSINSNANKEYFLNIALNKFNTSKGVNGLDSIIPLELFSEDTKLVTRMEGTNISSAYTTMSWLANKLQNEMDVYSFATAYKHEGLGIKKVDITTKQYDAAIDWLRNKSKAEALSQNDSAAQSNVFIQMQLNSYRASNELRKVFMTKLSELIDTNKIDIETVSNVFGNSNHRRDLGNALRKTLLSYRDANKLKLKSGFVDVTDEFAQEVLNNLKTTRVETSKDIANIRGNDPDQDTKLNIIPGSQFESYNADTVDINLTVEGVKEILKLIPLEYSVLSGQSHYSIETKLLAMLKSASHLEDEGLAISTKDLYELDSEGFEKLKNLASPAAKKKIEEIEQALQNSTYYNSRHEFRELELKRENEDIKLPSKSSATGDIIESLDDLNTMESLRNEINRQIHNASLFKAKEQYIKSSVILDDKFQYSYELSSMAELLKLHVLPFVDHQGSLQLQNLMIEENLYYFYHNLVDFSQALRDDYGLSKDAAINLAFNYYMYSTGVQTQAAHPEFLLIHKKSGRVMDVALTGSRNDADSGLIARLYNHYFEINESGTGIQFKKFTHELPGQGTITVDPKDLIAVRLQPNVISTTFKQGTTEVDIYDIGKHEDKFINIFIDKIQAVARAHSLAADTTPNYREELRKRVNEYFYTEDHANPISKNRDIINKSKGLVYGTSGSDMVASLEGLDVRSNNLTEAELALEHSRNPDFEAGVRNYKEKTINDIAKYGISENALNNTDGLLEYIDNADRKIIQSISKSNDSTDLPSLNELISILRYESDRIKSDLEFYHDQKISEEDIAKYKDSHPEVSKALEKRFKELKRLEEERQKLQETINIANIERAPLLDKMLALHKKVEGDNPEVKKGTEEYSNNAYIMREIYKPEWDYLKKTITPTINKLKEVQAKITNEKNFIERLYTENNLKLSPAFKNSENYSSNSEEVKKLQTSLSKTKQDLQEAINNRDKILDVLSAEYKEARDVLDLYQDNRLDEFKTILEKYKDNKDLNTVAKTMIKELIRRDKSVEGKLFKLLGYDADLFKNRSFERTIQVGKQHYKLSELLKHPFVITDSEVLFNLKDNTQHVYSVSVIYFDGNKITKASKYIPCIDPVTKQVITDINRLRELYPDFFSQYHDKFTGSETSIKNLLANKSDAAFENILLEANKNNATLIGFNSKEFDVPKLIDANILSKDKHLNLLSNQVDVFDLVRSPLTNVNLYGGKATLVEVAKQLGIEDVDKLLDAHDADADIQLTKEVLEKIIEKNNVTYSAKILNDIETLYKTIVEASGIDYDDNLISDTLRSLKLTDEEFTDTNELMALRKFATDTLKDNNYYSKIADVLRLINEKDVMNRVNVLVKALNKMINKKLNSNHIKFADTFSSPKIKNELIEGVAFLLRNIKSEDANDSSSLAIQCDKSLTSLAYNITKGYGSDKEIVDALVNGKDSIYNLLGIDTESEEFKTWRNDNQYKTHKLVGDIITAAYGKTLASDIEVENAKQSVALGLKPIHEMIDEFDFLPQEMKDLITNLSDNFYDYKGEYKDLSDEVLTFDALSNQDKATMDWYLTDPLLLPRELGTYNKATSTLDKITLMREENGTKVVTRPKNMTVYLSEHSYRQLMGYGDKVPIDYNNTGYIGAIRYPADKFDSIHYLKLEVMDHKSTNNLDLVISPDTMLVLNGDLDGDNIKLIRPDKIQSQYGNDLHTSGKYNPYFLLDSIIDKAIEDPSRDTTKDIKKTKQAYAITQDDEVATYINRDIDSFNEDSSKDYYSSKQAFIDKFKHKYDEKLLDSVYIKEPTDLSSLIDGADAILYISNLAHRDVLNNSYNIQAKRALMLGNASKHKIIAFNDTQSGMFQKGLHAVDWSQFTNLDFIDNAIRLSGTTREILDQIPDIYNFLMTNGDTTIKSLAKEFHAMLKAPGSNSDKVETLLKFNQLRILESNDYKTNLTNAMTKLKGGYEDSAFVKAFNRYLDGNTESDFFKTIDEIVELKKYLRGAKFKEGSDLDLTEVLRTLLPEYDDSVNAEGSVYNPGRHIPTLHLFDDSLTTPEDTIQWVGWTDDSGNHGANKYQHADVANTKVQSPTTLNRFASYEALQEMNKEDIKSLGANYHPRGKYYFVSKNNGIVTYVRTFNIDTAKVMVEGNANTKATPTKTINDLEQFDPDIQNIIKDKEIAVILRVKREYEKGDKISVKFEPPKDSILIKADGTETKNIDEAIGYYDSPKYNVLENTLMNDGSAKDVNLEESAYGNNMLGTGGVGMTYGIFLKKDSNGKVTLDIDNSRYIKIKQFIASMNSYDRYATDAVDLYNHLAVAHIINRIDPSELKGKTKSEYYTEVMSKNPREFIYMHLPNFQDLDGKVGKILSIDMFNKIYGTEYGAIKTNGRHSSSGNSNNIRVTSDYYTPKPELRGINTKYYNPNTSPNMTTLDFINAIRDDNDTYISMHAARKAEQSGLLVNKKLADNDVDVKKTDNTSAKTGQILGQHTLLKSNNDILDYPVDLDSNYYSKYKFETKGTRMANSNRSPIADTSKVLTGGKEYLAGKRLGNLLSSLLNTKGTYKDRDAILTSLNPNVNVIQSIHMPELFFDSKGNVKLRQRKVDVTPKGYTESSIAEARQNIYNQRRSPLYWQGIKELEQDSITDTVTNYTNTSGLRTQDALMKEDLQDTTVQESLINLTTESKAMIKYRDIADKYQQELNDSSNITVDKHGNFVSGNLVGTKVFEESKFSLNFGGKLKDSIDIKQNRSMRQMFVDEQNIRRRLDSELNVIKNLAKDNKCIAELELYAYVLSMNARLNSNSEGFNFTKEAAKNNLARLGITDSAAFIKDFIAAHKDIAIKFDNFMKNLDELSSKYSKDTNEPTNNIFRLLSPHIRQDRKERQAKVDSIKEFFKYGDPKMTKVSQGSEDLESFSGNFENYKLFDSLEETISGVSKRAAIVAHSERLKNDGVIDSVAIQTIMEQAFSDPEVIAKFIDPEYTSNKVRAESVEALTIVIERLGERFSNDETFVSKINTLKDSIRRKIQIKDPTLNVGEVTLELLKALSEKTSQYKLSLDDALELANKTNSDEADAVIYAYKQMQDIYAQLVYINKNACSMIANKLINYAKQNNLTLVDKYGRTFSEDFAYALNNTSLEYLPRELEKELSKTSLGYDNFLVSQVLSGNVFLMDSGLANILSKQVFIEKPTSGFQKTFQKTSGWCVKMLMSSPFKLIDRFFKFTLFDVGTLGSANHNTLLKQGEAYRDLRAFFSSKGAYSSKNFQEFIDTQGITFDGVNFDGLLTGDTSGNSSGLFKTYTNKVGDIFTFQTLSQRYAYWLATKEAIKNGDYSVVGSAYHLKNQMMDSGMTPGEQASFAMGQMLGSNNDFPAISKTFNRYGFVFTTFPLAATRYGIGELRSAAAAVQDLFIEGSRTPALKWIARNASGMLATLMLEQLLVGTTSSMYGVDEEDEDREEWEKVGALPNITQTLIQGQPIMDTFSSMNAPREVINLFIDTSSGEDDNVSGLTRFIRKNIISHVNPIVKSAGEVVLKKDLIDDQLIDTKDKYSAMENIFRKASAYFVGASGANAMVKTFSDQGYSNLPSTFVNSMQNAINAELGNTKAFKENRKNYYKMISLLNEYLYSDTDDSAIYSNTDNFNYSRYSEVKSKIYSLINNETPLTKVYEEINNLLKGGYTLQEVRAALKNCSVSGKLEKIDDYNEFIDNISEGDLQNLKTALAYENKIFPWLDESIGYLTKQINQTKVNPDYYEAPYYYRPNSYINSYRQPSYSRPTSSSNYKKTNTDVYDTYKSYLDNLRYKQKQAEYEANQKKWSDD